MKNSSISSISAAGKKESPTAMARVLLVGLALLLPGSAALATIDPVPGVDIVVRKNPGGIAVSAPTGSDGTYKFTGLAAGNYDLSVGGQRVQTVTVGANQGISGVLSSEPGGKASITFNGQVGVVPDLPSAPVSTSRSNKKAGIAKGEESRPPTNGIGGTGGGRLAFAAADDANSAMGVVSTTRGTAPGPSSGDGTLPGILRVINNSETESATVNGSTPVNGIGGQGGGRLMAGGANADSSNRDHIDQDAQFDIKKRTDVQSGGPGNARIRVGADVSTIRVQNYGIRPTEPPPGTDGGDGKLPGISRVINNSETAKTTINQSTPVNGIGGTGGGRLTAGGAIDGVNVDSSNRDHIDQDAQFDIKKRTDVQPDGPGNVRLRVPADVSTLRGDERDVKLGTVAMANEPLTDGLMILRKNSGGITISAPTGADGAYQFKGLVPGSYDLFVGGQRVQTINVGNQGSISGVLSRQPDGKASITFNGQVGVVPDLPNAIVTTRSNIKRPSKVDAATEGITPILDVDGNNSTDLIVAAPKGGDKELPGLASPGTPIVGIPIGLEGDPGSIKVSAKTDSTGAFNFDKLPAGKYKLTLPDLPSQSLTVGADGIAGGKVMRGPDGSMSIFDRWGNRTAASTKGGTSTTAEIPVGFGIGNIMGAGPGGMGLGPMHHGTMIPGTMSPGPMSSGAMGGAPGGGAMGPGRAMGGAGMGRP